MPVRPEAADLSGEEWEGTVLIEPMRRQTGRTRSIRFKISIARTIETEPSALDLLSEPIIQALMRADGVTATQVVSVLAQAAATIGPDDSALRRGF